MKAFSLTQKDLLELKFWLTCDVEQERAKVRQYLSLFGIDTAPEFDQVLEIGSGPLWGVFPYINARRKVAVDPLIDAYDAVGILEDRDGAHYYSEDFVTWDTNDKFEAIFCINALDHGSMGFHLLPKISNLLAPGGHLYIHVQFREQDQLNLIHDHALDEKQLAKYLKYTDLVEHDCKIMNRDFDPPHCPALIGTWRKI